MVSVFCGEIGIRTLEALSALTHFPGVRLRPLGHLSGFSGGKSTKNCDIERIPDTFFPFLFF